jgi:hypothetical protein
MFCRTILVLIAIFVCTAAHADQVVLQWDPNVEKELAGYILYYGNRSGISLSRPMIFLETKATIANKSWVLLGGG